MSNTFYGIYAGLCVNNDDPQGRSRLRLKIPQILGDSVTNWAEPCLPVTHLHVHSGELTTSSDGTPAHTHSVETAFDHKIVPELGKVVWVMFIGGDPNFPVWIGVGA